MRVTRLIIKNIGLIEDLDLEINRPLLLFYGEVRQGKSTILNAIRWVLGASWPADIIRHGAEEASITLELEGGSVGRSWYRSKSGKNKGQTVARDTQFVKAGRPVERPAAELARMLNPFLLDHEYLKRMTEAERRQYFVDTFPVDTKDLDTEAFNLEKEATQLRAEVKGYGVLDLTPVPESNALDIRQKLTAAKEEHAAELRKLQNEQQELQSVYDDEVKEVDLANEQSAAQNVRHNTAKTDIARIQRQITDLENELAEARRQLLLAEGTLEANKLVAYKPKPEVPKRLIEVRELIMAFPATSAKILALEAELMQSVGNEVKRQQFEANKLKAEERDKKEERVRAIEGRLRGIKSERIHRLAKCIEVVPGLSFNEMGEFTFEGTSAGMLSTSQIMRLSERLSEQYPEGFGLSLIDRAESLGKSVFEFVDRAKAEGRTILATIVGDAPAKAPDEIGVFVVEQGKVTEQKPKQDELI